MKRKPPIDLLLAMGSREVDVLTSVVCLTAALAVQRKESAVPTIEVLEVEGKPLSPDVTEHLLATIARARPLFESASPEQLQHAIDLYAAHLELCGFHTEWGTTH